MNEPAERRWSPPGPVDLRATLSTVARGPGDPSHRIDAGGMWRATRTPHGPTLLRIEVDARAGEVVGRAWGPGAPWALAGLPDLLGAADTTHGDFRPRAEHPVLVAAWRAHPNWRVPRTRAVFEALSLAAIEQVVTSREALGSMRRLITRYGDTAPGPAADPDGPAAGLVVPPTPGDWARIPTWEWLRAGVEQRRSGTVVRAARVAGRLEATLDLDHDGAERVMRSLRGVGRWTAAEVRQRAHGDPDAFSFDDYHVAKDVSYALTGEVLDDDSCAELIACYAGHRYRVQRLVGLAGVSRPRRGPRMPLPTHLPTRPRRRPPA